MDTSYRCSSTAPSVSIDSAAHRSSMGLLSHSQEDSFRSIPQLRHIPAHSLWHMGFIGMFIAAYWMAGSVRSST